MRGKNLVPPVVVVMLVAATAVGIAPARGAAKTPAPAEQPGAHAALTPKGAASAQCADIAVTSLTVALNEGGRVATVREAGFDRVRVTVLVRNTKAVAPVLHGPLRLSFFRDGQAIGQRDVTLDRDPTSIPLDDEFVHGAQPSHAYRAVVSSADNECRADNNEMATTVTEVGLHPVKVRRPGLPPLAPVMVRPTKPDLRADRMWFAERPDGTGELPVTSIKMFQTQVYLGCAYSNVGTDITKPFLVGVFDNGPLIRKENVAGLAHGASGQVVVPFPAHAFGQGSAWCMVDWGGQVEEANEANNRVDRSYTPAHGTPDLRVDRAYIDGPTKVTKGDPMRLVCEFSNAGELLVGGMYGWFYVDGKGVKGFDRSDLAPGQQEKQVLMITAGSPAVDSTGAGFPPAHRKPRSNVDIGQGTHSFSCWVNEYYDELNTEPQIPNNESPDVTFTVIDPAIDKPDFRIERIEFRPYNFRNPPVDKDALEAGSDIQILCMVFNDGQDFPGGAGKVRLLIDGEQVVEMTLPAIEFGQWTYLYYDKLYFMSGGAGSHTCTCRSDPDGAVTELREDNNDLSVPFAIVP